MHYIHRIFIAGAIALACVLPASSQEVTPDVVDGAISKVMALGPEQVSAKVAEYKAQADASDAEAAALKLKADETDKLAADLLAKLEMIKAQAAAVGMALEGEPMAEGAPMAEAAAPEMAPAPGEAVMAEPAVDTTPKLTYQDNILPMVRERCFRCHNQDGAKGGFILDNYASLMAGGGSGQVIQAGDPNASRLFRLVSGAEEPKMPPSGDGFTAEQLRILKDWIAEGAPQDKNSKVVVASMEKKEAAPAYVAAAIVDGPPPMPEIALASPLPELAKKVAARAVATSPRAPLMAVAGYQQVLLFDLENYTLLGALPFPEGDIYSLTFSVSGEVLVAAGGFAGDSGRAVVWNVRKADRVGVFGEEFDVILAADISPDHKMIALGGPSKKVKVYSVPDGAPLFKLEDHTDWIFSVKFSPDGELLASADRAGGLLLWQAANGRAVEALRGHVGAINDLSFTSDSMLLSSAGADGTVRVWDTWQYTQVRSLSAHTGAVLSVDYSDAGELITTGVDGQIKRWDAAGTNVATYEQLPDWGYQARFGASDAVVMAGAWTGEIRVWDTASGTRVADLATVPSS